MFTITRGDFAAIIILSTLTAGCPADDPTGEPSSTSDTDPVTTESTTDPSTTDPATTEPTTDPATTEPTTDPATTDPSTTDDPSTSTTDEPTSTGVDSTGDESTTEAAGLEIVGNWADEFGGVHIIMETSWVTTYGKDAFPYTITEYDNEMRWIIAQDDVKSSWSKYEWTYAEDDLWYCQTTFGEATAEDAMNYMPADPTDPTTSGCGGFAWSRLVPQG